MASHNNVFSDYNFQPTVDVKVSSKDQPIKVLEVVFNNLPVWYLPFHNNQDDLYPIIEKLGYKENIMGMENSVKYCPLIRPLNTEGLSYNIKMHIMINDDLNDMDNKDSVLPIIRLINTIPSGHDKLKTSDLEYLSKYGEYDNKEYKMDFFDILINNQNVLDISIDINLFGNNTIYKIDREYQIVSSNIVMLGKKILTPNGSYSSFIINEINPKIVELIKLEPPQPLRSSPHRSPFGRLPRMTNQEITAIKELRQEISKEIIDFLLTNADDSAETKPAIGMASYRGGYKSRHKKSLRKSIKRHNKKTKKTNKRN